MDRETTGFPPLHGVVTPAGKQMPLHTWTKIGAAIPVMKEAASASN
jgi:hypothetical protein